jgi:hypothetical protein
MNKEDRSPLLKTTLIELERWDVVRNEQWWDALPELAFLGDYK